MAGLVLWIVLVSALLVWEPAMWRAHVAHLVPPLALLAALRPRTVVGARGRRASWSAPFFVSSNRSILWPEGYTGAEAALVQRLERLPADALVISDDPGLVWRSGHRPPGALADPSFQRIDQGRITQASLVRGGVGRRRVRRDLVVAHALRALRRPRRRARGRRATPRSSSGPASRCTSATDCTIR